MNYGYHIMFQILLMLQITIEYVAAQYTTISSLEEGIGLILEELKSYGFDKIISWFCILRIMEFHFLGEGRIFIILGSGLGEPLMISSPEHKSRCNQATNTLTRLLDLAPTRKHH